MGVSNLLVRGIEAREQSWTPGWDGAENVTILFKPGSAAGHIVHEWVPHPTVKIHGRVVRKLLAVRQIVTHYSERTQAVHWKPALFPRSDRRPPVWVP